jgi:hypothetical protein
MISGIRVRVTVTEPFGLRLKKTSFNGDDTVSKPEVGRKGSTNIQYRWTSLDTSFDNNILLRFFTLGLNH